MQEKELRRSISIFPIGSVMKLTDLTARQIRYYEDNGLLSPERTDGNRRLYSLNDMDKLLEIKDFLAAGKSIAAIKEEYQKQKTGQAAANLSDEEVRRILEDEFRTQSGFGFGTGSDFTSRPF